MRMSITGSWNRLSENKGLKKNSGGFTLIELSLVIILMGFILSLTIPRIRDTLLTDDFKSTSRKIIGTIKWLRNRAVSENKDFTLMFDFESNSYWFESGDMTELERMAAREQAYVLPENVRITGILFKDEEEKTTGETSIRFSKQGYIRPSIIHLGAEDGRKFTFVLSPFLGKVKVLEEYLGFEDISQKYNG